MFKYLLLMVCFSCHSALAVESEDIAPSVPLPTLDGDKAGVLSELKDYRGKLVYLDFWASWCRPCRLSFPFLKALKEQYKDQGFEVVSINVDASTELALSFLKDHPVNHPILLDPQWKMSKRYQVQGLPTAFIINRDGVVVYKHLGFKETDKAWLTSIIEQQLALADDSTDNTPVKE